MARAKKVVLVESKVVESVVVEEVVKVDIEKQRAAARLRYYESQAYLENSRREWITRRKQHAQVR